MYKILLVLKLLIFLYAFFPIRRIKKNNQQMLQWIIR